MTEISYLWDGLQSGTNDAGPYDEDALAIIKLEPLGFISGVTPGIGNELEVTISAIGPPDTIQVNTGAGMIAGTPYRNTSTWTTSMPTSAADSYAIKLVKTWATKQVRLKLGYSYTSTTAWGDTWEISLASFDVSDTGSISNFVDQRPMTGRLSRSIGVRAYHDANQTISSSTTTSSSLNQERYDTDTLHDTVTNNSRLTCSFDGLYLINACWGIAAGGTNTGELAGQILLNGTTIIDEIRIYIPNNAAYARTFTTMYRLSAGDYVELRFDNEITSTRTLASGANYSPEFSMELISL